jgi:hypothetical protein
LECSYYSMRWGIGHLSHDNDNPRQEISDSNDQRGMSWPAKAILILLGATGFIFDDALGGWGRPVTMAFVALAAPVLMRQFREFWSQSRFWVTVSLLAIIQVPLVIAVRLPMQRGGPYYSLVFVIVDCLLVGFVILSVCSKSD